MNENSPTPASVSERDTAMVLLLNDLLKEQKRRRLTDTLFRLIFLGGFVFLVIMAIGGIVAGFTEAGAIREVRNDGDETKAHIALVEFNGELDASAENHIDTFNALKQAFNTPLAQGVILKINSPGGSPVVADELYQDIRALKAKHPEKKLMVLTGDVCASGGYYFAVAADKIFVNHSSIIGSIGVIHMSVGVQKLAEKLGIEPRIMTAGDRKAMLNPLEALKPEDKAHLQKLMASIHERFIAVVKEGRGDRLKSDAVFNGLFWTGAEAVNLGLADGISTVNQVAADELGETNVVDYTHKPYGIERLLHISAQEFIPKVVHQLLQNTNLIEGIKLLPQ